MVWVERLFTLTCLESGTVEVFLSQPMHWPLMEARRACGNHVLFHMKSSQAARGRRPTGEPRMPNPAKALAGSASFFGDLRNRLLSASLGLQWEQATDPWAFVTGVRALPQFNGPPKASMQISQGIAIHTSRVKGSHFSGQ